MPIKAKILRVHLLANYCSITMRNSVHLLAKLCSLTVLILTRTENPAIRYGYAVEGYPLWMDNVVVLKDAQNVENAKSFQNFLMAPENAALISNFANYANAIDGSDAYMLEELRTATEVMIPAEFQGSGQFIPPCPPDVQQMYTAIWTELQK